MAAPPTSLFKPGHNCHRTSHAHRVTLLVDGDAYFRAFAQAALRAKQTIVVVGWDFHSQTRLHLDEDGVPDLLGDFLNFLVERTPQLRIFILAWDCPWVFDSKRESRDAWKPRRGIAIHYDSNCPVGGAIHQKFAVIDGAMAFCGGTDLTLGRWDTPAHEWADARRANFGEAEPYRPVHDVMLAVDFGAARALYQLASSRWREATGRKLTSSFRESDPWPPELPVMFSEVDVAIARTVPDGPVKEVESLYLDMIAAAERYIYIENQYITSKTLGDALAARLGEMRGPEVIMVSRLDSSGWLEAPTMEALRTVLLQKLRDADAYGRFSAWYPDTPGRPGCDLHSKLMIVDDEWLRVGSANFANRSMGLDTECDLVVEARGHHGTRAAIASARNGLLAEHLGVNLHEVRDALVATRSVGAAVRVLSNRSGRTLRRFEQLDEPSPAVIALANGVADPERPPIPVEELIAGFRLVVPVFSS
jgi:phospholipase D1/2